MVGLDVDGDQGGALRVEGPDFIFYFGGYVVGFLYGYFRVYFDVHVDDDVGAAAACAQMMESFDARGGDDRLGDALQVLLRERDLQQLMEGRDGHLDSDDDDEYGDDDGGRRIADPADAPEKHRARDAARNGSLRWCQALATTTSELMRLPTRRV